MFTSAVTVLALALAAPFAATTGAAAGSNTAPLAPSGEVRWLSTDVAVVDDALVLANSPARVRVGNVIVNPTNAPVPVSSGSTGSTVARLQHRLRDLGVYRGEIDGDYGPQTRAAVVAVHKLLGTERGGDWLAEDWAMSAGLDHAAILERNPHESDRIEVDIERQVMFVIRDADVAAIVPVSTGNGETYWSQNGGGGGGGYVRATTPRGDYRIFKHVNGWRTNYLGGLYKPWYFTPYYAVHGSSSVPSYPASHGCVRVPTWESNYMDDYLDIGLPVHIWDA